VGPSVSHFTGESDAIHHAREADIGQKEDSPVAEDFHNLHGGFATFAFDDLNVGFLEDSADQFALINVVFNNERDWIAAGFP
jgi:hypothetical protein